MGATSTTTYYTGTGYYEGVAVGPNDTVYGTENEYGSVFNASTGATIIPALGFGLFGIAVDASGTIYAAQRFGSVYRFPSGSVTGTELSGVTSSFDVAVDNAGTLYAANFFNQNLEVYPSGATTPSYAITAPSVSVNPERVAVYPNPLTP